MYSDEIHLFIFRRQQLTLRYAAADRNVPVGEHTYTAATIERDAIRQTAERAKDRLKIRVAYSVSVTEPPTGWPSTQPLGDWWRPHIPSDPITVICMSYDPSSEDPPSVEWTGWVIPSAYDDTKLELICDPNPPAGSAGNQGSKFQRSCFKTVYSTGIRGCNLDPEEFEIEGELSAVSGLQVTAPEFVGTPYSLAHGWIEWTRQDGIVEVRPIMAHNNSTGAVTLLWGGADLDGGTPVKATPNCPGTSAACAARRADPLNHYGGAIYKPVKDPIAQGIPMSWG